MQLPPGSGSPGVHLTSAGARRKSAGSRPLYVGDPAKGRIKLLVRGQGSGIISTSRGNVFFHKADVQGEFWDLNVGDLVVFELLDDAISGPRAQRLRTARPRKGR